MRKRPLGVATAVAVLVLAVSPRPPVPSDGGELARLERATSSSGRTFQPEWRPKEAREPGHAIPLSGGRKHLIVDGTLNGTVRGPMLVDTGASYCVVTRGTARKLGLPARPPERIPVATANGQIDAAFVELDAVELRDARLTGVQAVVMDAVEPPLIGIIGLNFLTQFRFSVDLAEGTLRLEP